MSQDENPETSKETVESEKPSDSTNEEPQSEIVCHIHNSVGDWQKSSIRKNVCVRADKYELEAFEGKHYCLFHFPSQKKDADKFNEIFYDRLDEIDKQCAEIEAEFPDDEKKQIEAKEERNINYDFRYVYFPQDVNLRTRKFSASADFNSATFSASADFNSATFSAATNFSHATFSFIADFRSATFSATSNFSSATFLSGVGFRSATFSAEAIFRSATFPSGADFKSATFSAAADFNLTTFSAAGDFMSTTFLAAADFKKSTFSADANFISATFSADADFRSATFSANAFFFKSTFSAKAVFLNAKFSKESQTYFNETKFGGETYFDEAEFENAVSFFSAIFESESDVFFRETFFAGNADFRYCTAENYLRFANLEQGNESKFDFEEASFEKAKRISFHTCRLHPSWFVNVDSRKFVFTDVTWKNYEWKEERTLAEKFRFAFDCLTSGFRQLFYSDEKILNHGIKAELDFLEKRKITEQKKRLLEVACRQLAVNAEENNRYGQASKFRYMAMETKRLQNKGIWRFLNMHWFYKWSSGYGESWSRAAIVLVMIIFVCGFFYNTPFAYFEPLEKKLEKPKEMQDTTVGNVEPPKYYQMNNSEGFIHSLYVAALQRPEPKAAADSNLTKAIIILQTIFAPLQAALLALAIRRKFMR